VTRHDTTFLFRLWSSNASVQLERNFIPARYAVWFDVDPFTIADDVSGQISNNLLVFDYTIYYVALVNKYFLDPLYSIIHSL